MMFARAKDTALRIVVWNVRMALSRKWPFLCALKPDLAILPEVSKALPAPTDHAVWIGKNRNKGLGIVSFGSYTVSRSRSYDTSLEWVAPIRVEGPIPFFLLAVWTTKVTGGQAYTQAHQGFIRYRRRMMERPTVVAGDFNTHWPGAFENIESSASADLGLVSAYHSYYDVGPGEESGTTLYWHGNPKSLLYHFDYCLIPRAWARHVGSVRIGSYAEWIETGLSDHVPLVVDIRKGVRRSLKR
jgi:hypothetical protein